MDEPAPLVPEPVASAPEVSFEDTHSAFAHLSNKQLSFSYTIFKLMNNPFFVRVSSSMALLTLKLRLPVGWLIKATIYRQFCGGESIPECDKSVRELGSAGIGAILDYSVEGLTREEDFDATAAELLNVLEAAKNNPHIPIGCMKVTGIARFGLLKRASTDKPLNEAEQAEYDRVKKRLNSICQKAVEYDVPMYIDAEETWIQPAIDELAESMMAAYNRERAYVFTTLQLYRHDRLAYLSTLIEKATKGNFQLGVKLVRGAYLEKENERAREKGYSTPMQPDKASSDRDYNAAVELCIKHLDRVEICAGTHNEESCQRLVGLIRANNLPADHPHIYFSQLYGMSDYMSYNLARGGYNVTKYLPYGPVKAAVPYLIRRANENTAIAGQMSKELRLIATERKRRKRATRNR